MPKLWTQFCRHTPLVGRKETINMWILKIIAVGFFTAIGWGVADAYVVQPYIVPKTRVEVEDK